MRLFIAINLPPDMRKFLSAGQSCLQATFPQAKWVAAENLHLTLAFLGEIEKSKLPLVTEALQQACADQNPFSLEIKKLGGFPNLRNPRVIWVGISGELETLRNLKAALDGQLQKQGFAVEQRNFKPHLTLGRIKGEMNVPKGTDVLLAQNLDPVWPGAQASQGFQVQKVDLMQSVLQPKGPVYSLLHSFELTKN